MTFNVLPSSGEGESSVNDLALLSYLGLHDNTNQMASSGHELWSSSVSIMANAMGAARRRANVTKLAGVMIADGP